MRSLARFAVGFLLLLPLVPATEAAAATVSPPHVAGGFVPSTGYDPAPPQGDLYSSTPPASVDLRQYAPAVGDQGQVGSCVSWSIARGMMGYWATRTGGSGAPYAPLYLYMRTVAAGGAPYAGTNPDYALSVAQSSGVDTQEDYYQGTTNWQVPPTAAQIANAANYRVSGWTRLWNGANQGSTAQLAVQQAMAAGQPVGIAFPVFNDFMYLGAHSLYTTTAGSSLGGHMVAAFAYDSQGVWIRNSWGTYWGNGGDAKVSWSFINTTVQAAYTVSGITTPATPVPVAPTVASLSPNQGPAAGGTSVTISGAGLASATGVSFGGTPVSFSAVQSNGVTNLVVTSPPGAVGTVGVTVTNPTGTSAPATFTYLGPVPTVTGVNPATVPATGGSTVVLTGSNLTGATSVLVGARPATSVQVVNNTSLTFVAPAQPVGTYGVTVITPSGLSAANTAARLTYFTPPPVISAISPSGGLTYLSTPVVVTGSSLTGATRVTLGGVVVSFTRVSDVQLKVTLPAHAAGTLSLQVTTPGGVSAVHPGAQFTYRTPPAPAVTAISPRTGMTYQSTVVVVTGVNLTAATRVTASGVSVPFTRVSDTQLKVTMPAHAAGTLTLQVTTPGGTSGVGSDAGFTYVLPARPSITSLSQTSGMTYGSTTVLINGTTLTAASKVSVGGLAVPFSRLSATQLRATLPPHAAGTVPLQVTTPGGTSDALQFTYVQPPPPVADSLSVNSGLTYVSTPVTVRGTDLTAASRVAVGGTAVSFTRVSATELRATFPPHAAGQATVTVTTPGGTATAPSYTYVAPPPPVVSAVGPVSSFTYVSTTVTITGSNLTAASSVTLSGVAVSFTRISSTQITARLPVHAAGVTTVRVTTPGGVSNGVSYTYLQPPVPAVTALSPTSTLASALSTVVTITGTDLTAATKVTVGGATVPFTRISATSVRATLPRKAAGVYYVQVTTPGGTTSTVPAARFTYRVS